MDLDDPHRHGNPVFDHLSMPLFPALFASPSDPPVSHPPSELDLDDYHFGYDEQLAAGSRESGSESSGDFPPSNATGTTSMDITSEYGEIGAEYDGLLAPRRSVRARRLPPQLLASVPLELPDSLEQSNKSESLPPKSGAPRGRGRPRKHIPIDAISTVPSHIKAPKPSHSPLSISVSKQTSSTSKFTTSRVGSSHSPLQTASPVRSSATTPSRAGKTLHQAKATPSPPKSQAKMAAPVFVPSEHFAYTRTAANPLPLDNSPITDHTFPKRSRILPLSRFSGPSRQWFSPAMLPPSADGSPSPYADTFAFSKLKYITQPLQLLDCKSAVISLCPSPCGTMLACGTILGQVHIYAVDSPADLSPDDGITSSSSLGYAPSETTSLPSWNQVKWSPIAVLQDFSNTCIDEYWNLAWSPDSSHIIASGSCKSRTEFDHEDGDLKVLPSPLVVFDLRAHFDGPLPDGDELSLEAKRKHGIKRYEGHIEEVVSMKLWRLETATSEPDYCIFTSSQDGHVRKWKFDKFWNQLEASVQMQDDETWMAFALTMIHFPSVSVPPAPDNPSSPSRLTPRSLFLLAGDTTLKLFDPATNMKLYTCEPIYDTYCTSVEIFTSATGIEHPRRPGVFLNGDGRVYRDPACTRPAEEEPPIFLILTKGIDYLAPSAAKSDEPSGKKHYDSEEDDFEVNQKSSPTRVLLHALTIPLTLHSSMVPSMKGGIRRTEIVHRFAVDATRITFDTIYVFSHPLLECNYWPAKLAHNGNQVLTVSASGTVFAWTVPKTLAATGTAPPPSPPLPVIQVRRTVGNSTLPIAAAEAPKVKPKPIIASHFLAGIFASHDEDNATRDICFHPYWPFMFTSSDDGTVHVWGPTLVDPVKNSAVPVAGAEPPVGASLTTIVVPKGSNAAFSQPLNQTGGPQSAATQQQGSAYRSAVEAAMLASVGALMPAVAKRKRGRPPKKKMIEEIEAQFAAQDRAKAEQQSNQGAPNAPQAPYAP